LTVIDFLESSLIFLAELRCYLDYGLFLDFSLLDWGLDSLLLGWFLIDSENIESVCFTHSKLKLVTD
jgi:hypothetical protein